MIYLYKWNGEYFGFISGDNVFDKKSKWIGWIQENQVWGTAGEFVGDIFETNYILRNVTMIPPIPRVSKIPPVPPVPPVPSVNRVARVSLAGYVDALASL